MDFQLDLSSRLENRIENELLSDDSDELPIPGVGRRAASVTMSFDSDAGSLRQSSLSRHTSPTLREHETDVHVPDQLAVDTSLLNRELLNASDSHIDKHADIPSLSVDSLSASQAQPDDGSTSAVDAPTPKTESVHDDSSSDGLEFDSPSAVRSHSRGGSHSEVSTELPPLRSASRASARSSRSPTPVARDSTDASRHSAADTTRTSVSGRASAGHESLDHAPMPERINADDVTASLNSLNLLTAPWGNRSLPLGGGDMSTGSHVDTNRLLVYQHKLNETLTLENELLKARIDELVQIIQHNDQSCEKSRVNAANAPASLVHDLDEARATVLQLQRVVAEQSEKLDAYAAKEEDARPRESDDNAPECSIIHQTVDILQENHEQLLHDKPEIAPHSDMDNYVESLHTALNHAHGVINTMRPYVPTASVSQVAEAGPLPSPSCGLQRMQIDIQALTDDVHAARTDLDSALRELHSTAEAKEQVELRLADTLAAMEEVRSRLHRKAHSLRSVRDQYTETSLAHSMSRSSRGEMVQLERALSEAQRDLEQARREHHEILQQRASLETQLGRALGRYEDAQAEAEQARRSHTACEAQIDAQLLKIESLHQSLARRNSEIRRIDGEKAQMWSERVQIMEQLEHFERHLRAVREETEQYGHDLEELRAERERLIWERSEHASYELQVLSMLKPQLQYMRAAVARGEHAQTALVFQKRYLTRALASREWLCGRLCEKLERLAPVLAKYGGSSKPIHRTMRLRSVAMAVVAAYRIFNMTQNAREFRLLHARAAEAKNDFL